MQETETYTSQRPIDWDFLTAGAMAEDGNYLSNSHHSTLSTASGSSGANIASSNHSRFPSSSSSLASSPPRYDSPEISAIASHKKNVFSLPDVQEEPFERDGYVDVSQDCDGLSVVKQKHVERHRSRLSGLFSPSTDHEQSHSYYFDDYEDGWDHYAKRRRSGESARNSFTTRILTRLPSISKRAKDRKRASLDDWADARAESPLTPSRSSSRATSFRGRSKEYERDQMDMSPLPVPIETIDEDETNLVESLPDAVQNDDGSGEMLNADGANIERTTTPILPMLMTEESKPKPRVISPLQSPTVAPDSASFTPMDTPQISAHATPTISNRPSIASFKRGHQSLPPPPLHSTPPAEDQMSDEESKDEWEDLLGHANFRIVPEPYLPETFDLNSLKQLLADWEIARSEFSNHLARTNTYYGTASKTYKLTLEKWNSIDSQWKRNNDIVSSKIAETGALPPGHTPLEPAPIVTLPSMDDPQSQAKFPQIGDNDIVGRMEVAEAPSAPQVSRKPSKRSQFRSMFHFPKNLLGRSQSQRA